MRKGLWLLLIMLLSGCAHFKQPEGIHWDCEMQGALSFKQKVRGKSSGGRSSFVLTQNSEETRLLMIAPMGTGTLQFRETSTGAVLILPDKTRLMGDSADALWEEHGNGWPIPFSAGIRWLKGSTDENAHHLKWNPDDSIKSFESHGFLVEYLDSKHMRIEGHSMLIRITVNESEGTCAR